MIFAVVEVGSTFNESPGVRQDTQDWRTLLRLGKMIAQKSYNQQLAD